jgi:peroxiredoxin
VLTDPPLRELAQNTLVYFPDRDSGSTFETLAQGLEGIRWQEMSLAILAVLPVGAFQVSRRDLESRLAVLPPEMAACLQLTEDDEGGWTRTFGVSRTPSLFLIDARRRFVWKAEGELRPDSIAAAVSERLLPAPEPRFRPLRLRVAAGERAPDFHFRDVRGEEGALHRLRGRPVLLTFWQAWSAPCLAELRRLQALHAAAGRESPFIVAIHGCAPHQSFDSLRREQGISLPIVQDSEHRVAHLYGVRCWPTTITIGVDGRVDHLQFGMQREFDRASKP